MSFPARSGQRRANPWSPGGTPRAGSGMVSPAGSGSGQPWRHHRRWGYNWPLYYSNTYPYVYYWCWYNYPIHGWFLCPYYGYTGYQQPYYGYAGYGGYRRPYYGYGGYGYGGYGAMGVVGGP